MSLLFAGLLCYIVPVQPFTITCEGYSSPGTLFLSAFLRDFISSGPFSTISFIYNLDFLLLDCYPHDTASYMFMSMKDYLTMAHNKV